jgi:hypothetical protein
LAANAKLKRAAPAKHWKNPTETSKNLAQWAKKAKSTTQTEQNPPRKALSPLARAELYEQR